MGYGKVDGEVEGMEGSSGKRKGEREEESLRVRVKERRARDGERNGEEREEGAKKDVRRAGETRKKRREGTRRERTRLEPETALPQHGTRDVRCLEGFPLALIALLSHSVGVGEGVGSAYARCGASGAGGVERAGLSVGFIGKRRRGLRGRLVGGLLVGISDGVGEGVD